MLSRTDHRDINMIGRRCFGNCDPVCQICLWEYANRRAVCVVRNVHMWSSLKAFPIILPISPPLAPYISTIQTALLSTSNGTPSRSSPASNGTATGSATGTCGGVSRTSSLLRWAQYSSKIRSRRSSSDLELLPEPKRPRLRQRRSSAMRSKEL